MRASARWAARALVFGLVSAALAAVPACFEPMQPPCAFSCAQEPHLCPPGFRCGDDLICHDPTRPGTCPLTPAGDGGADTGTDDADPISDAPGEGSGP